MLRIRVLLPLLAMAIFLGSACGSTEECLPSSVWPGPGSPDELVDALQAAWNDYDIGESTIDRLFATGYQFEFFQDDVDTSNVFATWDRDEELLAHHNIFTRQTGTLPSGEFRGPALPVVLSLVEEDESEWAPRSEPPFEGTLSKSYGIQGIMLVGYAGMIDIDGAQGFQEFFAAPEVVDLGCGQTTTVYRLRHWRDRGLVVDPSKKHQNFTWGYLRSIYGPKFPPMAAQRF